MRFRLIPRDEGFFGLFNAVAQNAAATAVVLHEAIARVPDVETLADKARALARTGDDLAGDIYRRLDTAIITPFDREDIHALVESLDTAVDHLSAAADLLRLHRVNESVEGIPELGALVVAAAEAIVRAIGKLDRLRDLEADLQEVDRLEDDGDRRYRELTADLFSGRYDAFTVLRWHDILGSIEHALNAFERTADIVTSIQLKHS